MLTQTKEANIYKDERTGALINKDKGKLQTYKIQKKKMREMNDLMNRVSELEKTVAALEETIKGLLKKD